MVVKFNKDELETIERLSKRFNVSIEQLKMDYIDYINRSFHQDIFDLTCNNYETKD